MTESAPVLPRRPLTRDRVLGAAVDVADRSGLGGVTMRAVADVLGVEAMALYRHVSGKNDLLDALAEVVVSEVNDACADITAPEDPDDWRSTLRRRVLTSRAVLLRHPWAPALLGSHGAMGPALMLYFDQFGSILRRGGFSVDTVHHSLHAFGSRALGFSNELFQPGAPAIEETAADPEAAIAEIAALGTELPFIAEMVTKLSHDASTTLGWCDDQSEFEFGLDLLLDGLALRRR